MREIIFLILLAISINYAQSACTTITRTNAGANTVLTSAQYNSDLNAAYAAINSLDGECVQAATIQPSAIDSTTFGPVGKTEKQGCEISAVTENSITFNPCKIAVDGTISTSAASTVWTWGQAGDSTEATSTEYYMYAKKQSTFGVLVNTTPPDAYGYYLTNRIIARFYNDSSGYIYAAKVSERDGSNYEGGLISCGFIYSTSSNALAPTVGYNTRCVEDIKKYDTGKVRATMDSYFFRSGTTTGAFPVCSVTSLDGANGAGVNPLYDTISGKWIFNFSTYHSAGTTYVDRDFIVNCVGQR